MCWIIGNKALIYFSHILHIKSDGFFFVVVFVCWINASIYKFNNNLNECVLDELVTEYMIERVRNTYKKLQQCADNLVDVRHYLFWNKEKRKIYLFLISYHHTTTIIINLIEMSFPIFFLFFFWHKFDFNRTMEWMKFYFLGMWNYVWYINFSRCAHCFGSCVIPFIFIMLCEFRLKII